MRRFITSLIPVLFIASLGNAQAPNDATEVVPGQSLSILLVPEHPTRLRLNLAGSEAASILVDAAVPDINYEVLGSDGAEILAGHLATSGWAVIPFAAAGLRQVHLQFSTKNVTEDLPGVRVRVELREIPLTSLHAQILAAGLLASAQALHRSLHAKNLLKAIDVYGDAYKAWRGCGDSYAMALALGGEAESEMALSRYRDAFGTLAQASRLAGDHAYLHGLLLHIVANIDLDLWEGQKALGPAQEELQLGQQIQDDGLIALADADLAGVSFWTDFRNSGNAAKQARAEAVANGVPEALGLEGKWMGWIDELAEDNLDALRALTESEAAFRQAGDPRAAMQGELELASATTIDGDHYSALLKFQKLDQITGEMGNRVLHGLVLGNMGDIYRQLGKPQTAADYYNRAVAIFLSTGFKLGRAQNLIDLCETELDGAKGIGAVAQCTIALTAAQQAGYSGYIGQAKCDLGKAERKSAGDRAAFSIIKAAVVNSRSAQDRRVESTEHLQLGEILQKAGKDEAALKEFQEAGLLSESVTNPANLVDAHYAVAQWYLQAGQYQTAGAELKSALEKVEAARSSVGRTALQASYFAAERKLYELAVELRMREYEREPAGGNDAQALEMSERSRARSLLDALNNRAAQGAHEGGEAESHLMRAKLAVDRAFDRRLKLVVEGGAKRDLEASSAELTQALGDLERADDDVRAAEFHPPKPIQTMTATEIEQASLDSKTTFFEYALGAEHSYLWVIGGGKLKSYVLPSRKQLEEMVKHWRGLAAGQERAEAGSGDKLKPLSARLSCALFADAVQSGMTQMVIVPDGQLAMLPFAALPENGCSSVPGGPLVASHEVAMTPSLSVFFSRKQEAENHFQGEVAIVADPVFDAADPRAAALKTRATIHDSRSAWNPETSVALPRLLNTGYEANTIQDTVRKAAGNNQVFLAQGFDANVETVLSSKMQDYRIWHLATHGVYDETMPEFSGLVFSLVGTDGGPRFGFLKAQDIARLNVRAELVVLSACDSAAGDIVSGEGIMGLSYAFLHAGAKQVVSTLWSIDDAKSKELMVVFYKELMRNCGNAAAALRQSQLTVMRQPHNSEPYYWAGFELTSRGESRISSDSNKDVP